NWFFIVDPSPIAVEPANIAAMTAFAIAIRNAAHAAGVGGEKGEPIDHVILQGDAGDPAVHSRNFTLCPDDSFDRSPCGTGSSARLACLAADGRLAPGDDIDQESVIGSRYRLSYRPGSNGGVIPTITGQAWVMADSRLVFPPTDPFPKGFKA
ncbi:MAG: proline racemase family protein, partial [Pseudomonadota bacterium]